MLRTISKDFSVHDFRVVQGETHTNVIFDLVVPYDCKDKNESIRKKSTELIQDIDSKLVPVIYIEKPLLNFFLYTNLLYHILSDLSILF